MRIQKIIKRAVALTLAAAMLTGIAGCGTKGSSGIGAVELTSKEPSGSGNKDTEGPVEIKADGDFVRGTADFALSLFKNSAADDENFMVSPLSVLLALAMTANGAGGETLEQMEQVLCKGVSIDELDRYCKAYADLLPDTSKSRLSIANSVWIRDGFDVLPDFLSANSSFFDASVYKAPFDGQTVSDMNSWVNDKTHKMIDKIVEEIGDAAVMYLINAIAFEAEWQKKYEETQVSKEIFTEESKKQYEAEMMFSEEDYYVEDDGATGFVKNYLDGYAFVGLLPKEGVTVDEYIASMSGEGFLKMLADKKQTVVYATLPKFESEYSIELNNALSEMGMPDAFDGTKADFSGINAAEQLYIDLVMHKTYIKVDERGTKAGAVTSVAVNCEGAPMEIYHVRLDRPFVYAVVDTQTNLPIFIGAVRSLE